MTIKTKKFKGFHINSCLFFILLLTIVGCQQNANKKVLQPVTAIEPVVPGMVNEPTPFSDFSRFWTYYKSNIRLNEEFLAYDTSGKLIEKLVFLKSLSNGDFQPILINPTDTVRYKLVLNPVNADADIRSTLNIEAKQKLDEYLKEGDPLPTFRFETLTGEVYTPNDIKGKLLVIKCWFIACVPCVKEMPELNRLVSRYNSKKDIIFLSLALDGKSSLLDFLKKTKFDYQVVASQGPYMEEKLSVSYYPTHILVKSGKIIKIAENVQELEIFIERAIQ